MSLHDICHLMLKHGLFSVYVWGRGDLGQLGVGDDNNHNSPTLVATLANKKIVHVAAGDYHTAFLTSW